MKCDFPDCTESATLHIEDHGTKQHFCTSHAIKLGWLKSDLTARVDVPPGPEPELLDWKRISEAEEWCLRNQDYFRDYGVIIVKLDNEDLGVVIANDVYSSEIQLVLDKVQFIMNRPLRQFYSDRIDIQRWLESQ